MRDRLHSDRRCCMKTLRWGGLARISRDPPQDPHYRDEVEGPSHVQDEIPRCELGRPTRNPGPRSTRRCDGVVVLGGDRCLDAPAGAAERGGQRRYSDLAVYDTAGRLVV